MPDFNDLILRFFRDDIGGILITDEAGGILYSDTRSGFLRTEKSNWSVACPKPAEGQKAEAWDLTCSGGRTFIVMTSTLRYDGRLIQLHQLVDNSLYMEMYRNIAEYSKQMKENGDQDTLTRLFNKGKFMALKRSFFRNQETIAIYNLDINNLKKMNDNCGHEAGDNLIRKAAASLKKIEARNVIPFRVGGDEFIVIALHVTRAEAEELLQKWRDGLAELNARDDGIDCQIACGFVFAGKGYNLEELLKVADQRMYDNKIALKSANDVR